MVLVKAKATVAGPLSTTAGEGGQQVPPLAPHPFPPLPPPLPPPMTHAEIMAELLAASRESARAMEIMAQAVIGFARGGHGGNDGNGGGARRPKGPSSY